MNNANEASNRTLSLQRTFKAPLKLVWEAWTQPAHIAKWWGARGMTTQIIEHDFRVGGQWKYVMPMPDGSEFISDGVFSEIIEMEKICSSANFKPMTVGVEIQAFFEGDGDQTHFTFHVIHPTEEYCKQQKDMGFEKGWGSIFDQFETLLLNL